MAGHESKIDWSRSALLERVIYTDEKGRKFISQVPKGHEDEAGKGIILGPPDISSLNLPEEIETVLHNELFNRGLITLKDVKQRSNELNSALKFALRVNLGKLIDLYRG